LSSTVLACAVMSPSTMLLSLPLRAMRPDKKSVSPVRMP
jgi:hypothetical protein